MPLDKTTYEKLYKMLGGVSPLEYDCGILCGSACCREGKDLGIYLFPGEERLFTGREDWLRWQTHRVKDYDFPPSWHGSVPFINCIKPCPREKRPLQCRFYPLTPHLLSDGTLLLILDPVHVPYQCPIIEQKLTMVPEFIDTVYQVWKILLRDKKIRDLVEWDSRERESRACFVPDIVLAEDRG